MTLTALANTVGASVSGTCSKVDELSVLTDVLSQNFGQTFALGTGANQADGFFHDEGELANAAGTVTLNFLTAGSLTDKLGEVINFAKLKALVIKNTSADATLIIGNAASNAMALFGAAAHTLILQPGGTFVFICADASGLDISSNSQLKLLHGSEGEDVLTYQIMVLGVQTAA